MPRALDPHDSEIEEEADEADALHDIANVTIDICEEPDDLHEVSMLQYSYKI